MKLKPYHVFLAILVVIFLTAIISSCVDGPRRVGDVPVAVPQVVQAAPSQAPVIVQQSSNDGFWQGMMIGHLFSSGPTVVHHYDSRPAYVAPRTTVQNTTIVNKTVVQSAPRPAPAAGVAQAPTRPSAPTTSYSPPRATSYSGSYSSRPSYSSYSSRASFSSGRR